MVINYRFQLDLKNIDRDMGNGMLTSSYQVIASLEPGEK